MIGEHGWETWVDPAYPVTGPPIYWPGIDTIPLHYTAAVNLIDGDPGEYQRNIPAYLRAINKDYLLHRPQYRDGVLVSTGYSIGYNMAVDWLGGIWKLRGWGIRCAANKGHNEHTFAILCLVDGNDPLTSEARQAVRAITDEAQRFARRQLRHVGHLDIGSTGCPGTGIIRQVRAGSFVRPYPLDPGVVTPPVVPPAPVPNPPPLPPVPPTVYVSARFAAGTGVTV